MDVKFIREVLNKKYGLDRGYFCFDEFNDYCSRRIIDMIAFGFRATNRYEVISLEIKMSVNDFCRDKSDPTKRSFFVANSNKFYYVCPDGLINPQKTPDDCGLMYVYKTGVTRIIKEAPRTEIINPNIIYGRAMYRLGSKYGYNGKAASDE